MTSGIPTTALAPGSPWLRRALPVILILYALGVRLAFMVGINSSGDDWLYRRYAHNLLRGSHVPNTHMKARLAFIAPLALSEHVFGVNDFAGAAFPMACSLLGVLGVYALGTLMAGRAAGMAAGIVAATVPNTVFWGGMAMTDVPCAALMTWSIVFLELSNRRRGFAAAAGLALGAAYLMRESAVLLWAVLLVFWICRRTTAARLLLLAAGFGAILLTEAAAFWILTGDPLGRIHCTLRDSYSVTEVSSYVPNLCRRLTIELPSMLFNPLDVNFAFFGLTFPSFALAAIVLRSRTDARGVIVWWITLFLAILLVPISLDPFLPAVIAHPRTLEPLVPPACVLIGMMAVSGSGRGRLLTIGAWLATVGVGLYGCAVLHADCLRRRAGAVAAYEFLQDHPAPRLADGRLAVLFDYWDGFPDARRTSLYPNSMEGLAPGTFIVVDEFTLDCVPPDSVPVEVRSPPDSWSIAFEKRTTWRPGIRAMFWWPRGREGSGYRTVVYRVPP